MFENGEGDGGGFTEDGDLEEARVDGMGEIGYLFKLEREFSTSFQIFSRSPHEVVGLPYLIGGLFQSPLRSINPPVALIDIFLHISHIVVLETVLVLVGRGFIFGLQRFAMDLGAGAQVLLGVRKKIVRTCANKIGATDFWVCDGELSVSRRGTGAHELLCEGINQRSNCPQCTSLNVNCHSDSPSSFLCSAAMAQDIKFDREASVVCNQIMEADES